MAKRRRTTRRPPAGRRVASGPSRRRPAAPEAARRSPWPRVVAVVAVVALGWLLFVRAPGPGAVPGDVLDRADAAGCDALERPVDVDPGRDHLAPGDEVVYPDEPPAAGTHDPSPLPADPHVHEAPVSAARAVHNLEHAYVVIWYRPALEGGLAEGTVTALEAFAREQDRVLMAPYPSLPEGRSLGLVAWNTRWLCPALDAEDATAFATAFVDAYRGTTNAPEAPRGLLGPLLVG